VATGAGAAGGCILREKGYKVQKPVEKEPENGHKSTPGKEEM
jgi:hypothetical protein